jgi:peptide/nickel transport system permease protein
VQAVAPQEFVLAARLRGEPTRWIMFREILPNIVPILLVEAAFTLTRDIFAIAALSFLGLGVRPPSSNWGVMVYENRPLVFTHPVAVIAPCVMIALLAISINLIADAMTQASAGRGRGHELMV